MTTDQESATSCPADVMQWIPWYPGPGLSEEQKAAVEVHVACCSRCRDELALVTGEAGIETDRAEGAEAVYERVMLLIGDGGPASQLLAESHPPPRPVRGTIVAEHRGRGYATWQQAVLMAGLAGLAGLLVGLSFGGFQGEPVYRTAAALGGRSAHGSTLEVVFREEATAKQIQHALRALGARVVSGPNESGVMRVALPPESDADEVAMLLAEEAGIALFAQPGAAEPDDEP